MEEAIKIIDAVLNEVIFMAELNAIVLRELWLDVDIMLLELQIKRLMRCREIFLEFGFGILESGKMAVATLTEIQPVQGVETINLWDLILKEDNNGMVGARVELRMLREVTFLNFKEVEEGTDGVPVPLVQEISTDLSARMTAYDLAG